MNTMIKNSVNLCELCVSVLNIFSSTEAQSSQSYTEKFVHSWQKKSHISNL